MRTQKELSQIVEKTITEITKGKNTNDSISKTCSQFNVSEKHIRRVLRVKHTCLT